MRFPTFALILFSSLLLLENVGADKKKRREQNDVEKVNVKVSSKKHQYQKYSDEANFGSSEFSPDEEADAIPVRQKKEKKQKKKTLGALFEEKSQRKKEKKEKFKKNVLKHFDLDDDTDEKSSEEIIAPLRKVKLQVVDDCDSSEENCM